MLVLAHRGLVGADRPENTVAAVEAAFVAGAHGVEVDVRLSADGVATCCHDAHLSRVAGVATAVSAARWSELAAVRLAGGHRLARLGDVVAAVPDGGLLVAELKPGPGRVCAAVAGPLLAAAGRLRVVVSSVSAGLLRELAAYAPGLATALTGHPGATLDDLLTEAARYGIGTVHPHVESALAAATRIDLATAAGYGVLAWPVNRPVDVACLAVTGLTGVITDDVPAALAGLRRPLTGLAV